MSSLSVLVSHINTQPNHYTLNITYGKVLHIGDLLSNVSLSVGDTIDNSVNIYQSGYTVRDIKALFTNLICKHTIHQKTNVTVRISVCGGCRMYI